MSILKHIRLILKIILCSTGSQCSSFRVSRLIWSNLRKQAITHTSVFWTLFYSLLNSFLGWPCKSELQKSSLEFMNACPRTPWSVFVINIDILANLSYISEMVEFPFNYFVDMKRYRFGIIENDADITRLICRLDDIISQVEGSRGGSLNLE